MSTTMAYEQVPLRIGEEPWLKAQLESMVARDCGIRVPLGRIALDSGTLDSDKRHVVASAEYACQLLGVDVPGWQHVLVGGKNNQQVWGLQQLHRWQRSKRRLGDAVVSLAERLPADLAATNVRSTAIHLQSDEGRIISITAVCASVATGFGAKKTSTNFEAGLVPYRQAQKILAQFGR